MYLCLRSSRPRANFIRRPNRCRALFVTLLFVDIVGSYCSRSRANGFWMGSHLRAKGIQPDVCRDAQVGKEYHFPSISSTGETKGFPCREEYKKVNFMGSTYGSKCVISGTVQDVGPFDSTSPDPSRQDSPQIPKMYHR